jgi:uncharacterized membrane protein HdeD (DUF308 family)
MHWSHAAGISGTRWVRWLLVLAGVMGIAAGVIVLAEPAISLVTLAVVTGIFCVADGIVAAVAALLGDTDARFLSVFAAIVGILIGVILIRHPIAGIVALAVLLGLWLIAAGVIRLAWIVGGRLTRAWWWVLVTIIEIAAGIVIISSPRIAVTTLALLVGISFIVRGFALAAAGWLMIEPETESETPRAGGPVAAT